jgi:hypothetical protein
MPLHPNVRRCTHIQVTGHRCGSPALKQEYFCYFHTRMIKGVQTRVDSQIHPIALIENAEAIQAAIMHMIDAVLKGAIDNKRATIVLKALYIAVRNSRNVYFHIRQDDMVREVPNYAHQYLTEHPELNDDRPPDAAAPQPENGQTQNHFPESSAPPQPQAAPVQPQLAASDATVATIPPKRKSHKKENPQEECHPEEAQAFAKRRPVNEGSVHFPADTDAARTPGKTSHSAKGGNDTTLNSPHLSETNREKAWGENIPPLTTRQSERWNEIKKLEASIEGAMRGDWRDLRTVFNAVGLTPLKPPSCQRIAPNRKGKDGLSPGAEKA